MLKLLLTLAVVMTASAPSLARSRPKDDAALNDPNRMICRTTEVIGSRLGTSKRCMTAMQWDQLEREQRATVDRIQAFKPNNGN